MKIFAALAKAFLEGGMDMRVSAPSLPGSDRLAELDASQSF